jgi:thiol:disulfide interchange protein
MIMKLLTFTIWLIFPVIAFCQETVTLYNPEADAARELEAAIQTAAEQNKHVLVQVGGNWCSWCIRLHGFMESNRQIDSILKADYVLMRINFSPENKNPEVLARLDYPQRFGFPVLLVLDANGRRLHTQDTGLLELDKGYDPEKVRRFLLTWNRSALEPKNYMVISK